MIFTALFLWNYYTALSFCKIVAAKCVIVMYFNDRLNNFIECICFDYVTREKTLLNGDKVRTNKK